MRTSFLLLAAILSPVLTLQAIVDTNQNGLSDLWERQHNDDELFPETFDPDADPDADGWSNAQEAAAGTDPSSTAHPDGQLQPETTHIPATWVDTDNDNIPDSLVPEIVQVSWPTIPGKHYTFQSNVTLAPDNWINVGSPFIGTGTVVTYGFFTSAAATTFWRVNINDIDSDGDNLSDAEETQIGSNTQNRDSDGDGLPDDQELLLGTNPHNSDTDGDSISDANEAATGHDPKSNQSFPPRWVSTQRRGATMATPAYVRADWDTNLSQVVEDQPNGITVDHLVGPLAQLGFPPLAPNASPLPAGYSIPSEVAGGYRYPGGVGELSQARCWLQSKPAVSTETKRTVLRVTTGIRQPYGPGKVETSIIEKLEVVIPANATQSAPVDLLPTFATLPSVEEEQQISSRLHPVEFKKMWETKNKANQIWNPTKKDDPATTGQQPNAVGQLDGVPRNKLYAVTDPGDGKYKVTVELGLPEAFRTKFYAAAYVGETKVANSDKAFTDQGLCNLEFAHSGASGAIESFAIRVGYDANSSTTLEPTEQIKLLIYTTSAKNATGEVFVLGTNADRYADAIEEVDNIVDGDWTAPGWATDLVLQHAKRFLQIFRDGNSSGLAVGMQPSSSRTVGFNAFSGFFCEWLTHNSGAPLNDNGISNIPEYTWDKSKSASQLVSRGKQIKDAINDQFASLDAQVRSDFENQPVGTVRYYPSADGAYDLTHNHESPVWVTRTSVLFHNLWQIPPLPMGDDLNGTIGRGRLSFHKVRYRVERRPSPGPQGTTAEELNVTAETTGEVWDSYDWNHEVTGAAQNPAILQIGFGNGAYGSNRDRGRIYLTHITFDDIYDIRQIPTWP